MIEWVWLVVAFLSGVAVAGALATYIVWRNLRGML